MNVLALETATIEVGAAIVADEASGSIEVLSSRRVRSGRMQAETLHPLIKEIVDESGVQLCEIDAIVVDKGPGLFTGLRVGVASAKALAFALDVPVVGLTSTEILCTGARCATRPVVAIIDVRRGEVVYARADRPDQLVLCRPAECIAMLIADDSLAGALLVGDGVPRYASLFAPIVAERGFDVGGDELYAPDPSVLGELGIIAMRAKTFTTAFELQPIYLREADATINWATRDLSQVQPT